MSNRCLSIPENAVAEANVFVIYQWPGCDVGKTKCELSAHIEAQAANREERAQVVLSSSGHKDRGSGWNMKQSRGFRITV